MGLQYRNPIFWMYVCVVSSLFASILYLRWLWRDGPLDPIATGEAAIHGLGVLGPVAIILDLLILSIPLAIYFRRKDAGQS